MQIVERRDFDANPDYFWKQLRDQIVNGNKARYKNFSEGEKSIEDYGKITWLKKEKEYFIGMKVNAQYKDYKGYLLEQRDQLLGLVYEIDKALGIRSAIK